MMKKYILYTLLFGITAVLLGCNDSGTTYTQDNNQPTETQNLSEVAVVPTAVDTEPVVTIVESTSEGLGEQVSTGVETASSIEVSQFEQTIVGAGNFWEDWWFLRGPFAYENIDSEEMLGFKNRLLPSSGFTTLDDIRSHLSNWFTIDWIENQIAEGFVFSEYFDMIYVSAVRIGTVRPDWNSATVRYLSSEGDVVRIEAVVQVGAWHRGLYEEAYARESTFLFTFRDGLIDDINRNIIMYEPQFD